MHGLLMRTMISGQKRQIVRERVMEERPILPGQKTFRGTEVEMVLGNGILILDLEIVSRGN